MATKLITTQRTLYVKESIDKIKESTCEWISLIEIESIQTLKGPEYNPSGAQKTIYVYRSHITEMESI